jgi:hypothetical protein
MEPEPESEPELAELDEQHEKLLPLAFVVEPNAFGADEQRRALSFLQLFEAKQVVSIGISAKPPSFTPLSLSALPDEVAHDVALAELRWLTRKMLEIAVHADRKGRWGYTTEASTGAHGLEPSDELIYNRFGECFSDNNFSWHTDDAEPGPRDVSVVAYFTEAHTFEGGELQLQCDTNRYELPRVGDYSGNLAS